MQKVVAEARTVRGEHKATTNLSLYNINTLSISFMHVVVAILLHFVFVETEMVQLLN